GINEATVKSRTFYARKRLAQLVAAAASPTSHGCLYLVPDIPDKRRDADRHHRVQIFGTAHNADVSELRMRLACEMRADPLTQHRRSLARLQQLEMRDGRRGEDAIPDGLGGVSIPLESGFLRHLPPHAAVEVDHAVDDVAGIGDPRGKIDLAGVER